MRFGGFSNTLLSPAFGEGGRNLGAATLPWRGGVVLGLCCVVLLVEVTCVTPPPNLGVVEVTRDLMPVIFPPPVPVVDARGLHWLWIIEGGRTESATSTPGIAACRLQGFLHVVCNIHSWCIIRGGAAL